MLPASLSFMFHVSTCERKFISSNKGIAAPFYCNATFYIKLVFFYKIYIVTAAVAIVMHVTEKAMHSH